ncbi:MAG: CpsB/CapC family capsule biosynthesis tyrosine phosphatase [Erysipelotrichaceae bacterium]
MALVDIHNHIGWDIDDGMPDKESAELTLKNAQADGITTIIATPHVIPGVHTKQRDIKTLNERLDEVATLAKNYNIKIIKGCEIFLNYEFMNLIEYNLFNTLGDSNYILVEFDVRRDISTFNDADDYLYELTIRNYRVIIAHVERYFHRKIDLKRIQSWINMGCYIQVNRTSLLGLHGSGNQSNANKLLENGLVHLIASDTHQSSGHRICKLSDVYDYIKHDYDEAYADLLLNENPNRIIKNEELKLLQFKRKTFVNRFFWKR